MFWVISGLIAATILFCLLILSIYWCHKDYNGDGAGGITIFLGALITICFIPSFVTTIKDTNIKYLAPSSIAKTNDITFVSYVGRDGNPHTWTYNEASYWNCTNILIKEVSGKNIWGVELVVVGVEIKFPIEQK